MKRKTTTIITITICLMLSITANAAAQWVESENQVEEYGRGTWARLTEVEKFTYILGYMGGVYAFEQVAWSEGRPSSEIETIYAVLRPVIYSYAALISSAIDDYYAGGGTLPLWRLMVIVAQDVSQFTPSPEERKRGDI